MTELQAESSARSARLLDLLHRCATPRPPCPATPEAPLCREALAETDAFFDRWAARFEAAPGGSEFAAGMAASRSDEKAMILGGLGKAYQRDGRIAEARAAFAEGLALLGEGPNPNQASLLVSLGQACAAAGDFAEADRHLARATDEHLRLAGVPELAEMRAGSLAHAVRITAGRADLAMGEGRRLVALARVEDAIHLAEQHGLTALVRELELKRLRLELMNDATGEALHRVAEQRRALRRLRDDPVLGIDARLLLAEAFLAQGAPASAVALLEEARTEAAKAPHRRWKILFDLAWARREGGDVAAALSTYEEALAAAREMGGAPDAEATTLRQLIPLGLASADPAQRAAAEVRIDELRTRRDRETLAFVLQQRAMQALDAGDPEAALRDLHEAEQHATSPEQRLWVLLGRVAGHREAGRIDQALELNVYALSELEALARAAGGGVADQPAWIRLFGSLHENAACLSADLGRPAEALAFTERGRAVQLRRDLGAAGGGPLDELPLAAAQAWLADRRSAIAYLCVKRRRTLVVGLAPGSTEPIVEHVDLGEAELGGLLPAGQRSEAWNDNVLRAARALESRLAPPLARIAERCRTLYVVPDSRLCFLPFAALACPGGGVLLDRCALSLVPSLGVLRWCHARALHAVPSSCLAVAVGDPDPLQFADHARAVAALGWASVDTLIGPEATSESVLGALAGHDVIHLAVHGWIEPPGGGQRSSSRLKLAGDPAGLSADRIAALGGRLHADVVFLNACLSGRFEEVLPGEIGGFWEAFLRAGTSTLIAPLTAVKPDHASALALGFHRRRLGPGVGKAEAFREAQLDLRRTHPESEAWAAHVLVGDGG